MLGTVLPVVKPLLGPHLEDLEKKIQPGMFILTWTSMNIDGYLHRIHTGLARLEELIRKARPAPPARAAPPPRPPQPSLRLVARKLEHWPALPAPPTLLSG